MCLLEIAYATTMEERDTTTRETYSKYLLHILFSSFVVVIAKKRQNLTNYIVCPCYHIKACPTKFSHWRNWQTSFILYTAVRRSPRVLAVKSRLYWLIRHFFRCPKISGRSIALDAENIQNTGIYIYIHTHTWHILKCIKSLFGWQWIYWSKNCAEDPGRSDEMLAVVTLQTS